MGEGKVSGINCSVVIELFGRISREYHCEPQGIVVNGGMGFNIGGQEVGRVTDRPDGGVDILYCAPGSEKDMPVFGERF